MGRMPCQTVSVIGGIAQDLLTITDRLPEDGETVVARAFSMAPGGKGANSAVAVYRLTRPNPKNLPLAPPDGSEEVAVMQDNDIHLRMIGAVGDDQFGPELKANLEKCRINTDGVRVVEGQQTTIANILLVEDTCANSILEYPGAAYSFQAEDFMTPESLGGGVVPDLVICQLEISREAVEQAIETAGKAGIDVLLNPSPAHYVMPEVLTFLTHIVMNETEAVQLSTINPDDIKNHTGWSHVANYFIELGVKNVVVTLAAKGAHYANEFGSGTVEAEKNVLVVDTSGAGWVIRS